MMRLIRGNYSVQPLIWQQIASSGWMLSGNCTVFTDAEKTVLRFGFVIVDASKRGKGYGKQMLRLALNMPLKS